MMVKRRDEEIGEGRGLNEIMFYYAKLMWLMMMVWCYRLMTFGIDVEEGYGYQTYEGYLAFAVACFLTQMLRQQSLYLKFLMSQVLQLQPQMLPC